MQLTDIIKQRSSYYDYCDKEIISDATVRELVELTTLAPTAYNLQNWQFIAVKSVAKKEALYHACYKQKKVKDAGVTFVICGDMHGFKNIDKALQNSLDAKQVTQLQVDKWVQAVNQSHQHNPKMQRDEAFRSASLASMLLMLVAEDKGFATGAMSGFDTEKVQSVLGIPKNIIPVMLVTIGTPTSKRPIQKKRCHTPMVLNIV